MSGLSDMSGSGNSGNWCSLPGDIWFSIGLRLDAAADRVRFRAVSKTLRSHLPYRQPPWLMLSEYHESDSEEEEEDKPPRRRFVTLGEQTYYKWDLPQAHLARCVGSTDDWVITVKTDRIIRLLNPFSKLEIDLPSQITFEHKGFVFDENEPTREIQRDSFLRKVIIHSSSSSSPSDFLVIAIQKFGMLAMVKPGDSFWTSIEIDPKANSVRDIIVYQGRLYAINWYGRLLSSDITSYPDPPKLSVVHEFDIFQLRPFTGTSIDHVLYLVEWCGHLLLVIKHVNSSERDQLHGPIPVPPPFPLYTTERFQIYRYDFGATNWSEVKSLGEYSLFLGFNTSVSVLASDYLGLVNKNCIYFTDDFTHGYRGTRTPGGYDMGVFHLEDDTITQHYTGKPTCLYSPPIWIVPR